MTGSDSVLQSVAVTDEKSVDEKGSAAVIVGITEDHDAEVGYELYKQARDGSLDWTPEEERRVLRRIDAFILPVLCVTQGLAFLDKTALNLGNLFGMKAYAFSLLRAFSWWFVLTEYSRDLHVNGSQFSWFASAFYLGYLVFAEPATWLLQRYPTSKGALKGTHTSLHMALTPAAVMGSFVFVWGIVVMWVYSAHWFLAKNVNLPIGRQQRAGLSRVLWSTISYWVLWRLV